MTRHSRRRSPASLRKVLGRGPRAQEHWSYGDRPSGTELVLGPSVAIRPGRRSQIGQEASGPRELTAVPRTSKSLVELGKPFTFVLVPWDCEGVDRPRSVRGNGICEEICPDLFCLADGHLAYVRQEDRTLFAGLAGATEVSPQLEDSVLETAEQCPAECIFIDVDRPGPHPLLRSGRPLG